MLNTRELVQVNATIIGGVLIFMTLALTSFSDKESSVYRFIITIITSSVLIPFAISAIKSLDEKTDSALRLLKFGFLYTIAIAIVFVVLSYLGDIASVIN